MCVRDLLHVARNIFGFLMTMPDVLFDLFCFAIGIVAVCFACVRWL